MEDDAGKSIHDGFKDSDRYTYVDLNRCGTPLIEIVSEPDMRSSDEAYAYLTELKQVLQYVEVSTCDMEKGHLRCDANVSVRLQGRGKVRHQGRGQEPELVPLPQAGAGLRDRAPGGARSKAAAGSLQETRLYNPDTGETVGMRSKEHAHDYRYFPEPDLVPLRISEAWLGEIRSPDAGAARRQARPLHRRVRPARVRRRGAHRDARRWPNTSRRAASGLRRSEGRRQLGDGRPGGRAQGRGQGDRRIAGQPGAPGRAGRAHRQGRDLRQARQGDLPEDVRLRRQRRAPSSSAKA